VDDPLEVSVDDAAHELRRERGSVVGAGRTAPRHHAALGRYWGSEGYLDT
jgi:hypothetical protein